MKKRVTISYLLCGVTTAVFCSTLQSEPITRPYVPHGPEETAVFEKELFDLPVAASCFGIMPRQEILAKGMRVNEIPSKYVENAETWLRKILKERLITGDLNRDEWVGLPKLQCADNVIVGRYPVPGTQTVVNFVDELGYLDVTVVSEELFPLKGDALEALDVKNLICANLNIPADKAGKLEIEYHTKTIAETPICYGVVRCEYDEDVSTVEILRNRKWWSRIPFWITQGRMCIMISTRDWANERPAAADHETREF